jgi:hypothetical protein
MIQHKWRLAMSNLAPNDEADVQTEPTDPTQPQPAVHGQVHVSAANQNPALSKQMRAHLAEHEQHLKTTADYHRPTVPATDAGASQSSGGARADYQTTSEGSVGDADSGSESFGS